MVVVMKHLIKKIPSLVHWGVKERPFRLLIISDLHVGSITALCSEKPVISDHNNYHLPNKLQKALFKAW